MQLLPDDRDIGWTPYAWLVYLAIFVAWPFFTKEPLHYVATFVGLAVFLVLYFYGYWARGRRLLVVIAAIVLLGVVGTPWNYGATAFFIYAAAFLGRLGRPSLAARLIVAIVAVVAIEAWSMSFPPMVWIPPIVFSIVIGGVNIHFSEVGRANAKLLLAHEEVERLATLAERERIARDLHDLLGHTLSVITLKSQLAARLVESEPARAAEEMRDVEETSRRALSEVRKTVEGYRLAKLGAELAKAKLALRTADVSFELEEAPIALSPDVENALALAVREAVTNVVRHADATRCRITLAPRDSAVELEIRDDGRGGDAAEGSGLSGMRERVESVGGTMTRDGARGTCVSIVVPGDRSVLAEVAAVG